MDFSTLGPQNNIWGDFTLPEEKNNTFFYGNRLSLISFSQNISQFGSLSRKFSFSQPPYPMIPIFSGRSRNAFQVPTPSYWNILENKPNIYDIRGWYRKKLYTMDMYIFIISVETFDTNYSLAVSIPISWLTSRVKYFCVIEEFLY